jgi:murein DD-endopeptidase MepM/ murein hydrolase activator NlpD
VRWRASADRPIRGAARLFPAILLATLTLGVGLAYGQTDSLAPEEGQATAARQPDASSTAELSGSSASGAESNGGTGGSAGSGGVVKVLLNETKPRTAWAIGPEAVFHYRIAGDSAQDLQVQVIRKSDWTVVRTYPVDGVVPDEEHELEWNGKDEGGAYVEQGKYKFRIRAAAGQKADASGAEGRPRGAFYGHKFPVRGRHQYWDGFGAGRDHMGQDVGADCGTKVVAARGGKVQFKAYHSAAGYYAVIDGKKTKKDYVYMHLRDKAAVREGARVQTGEKIGSVGETGNASGCHLHFELWKGDWYNGGQASPSVTRKLKRWDSWS